METLNDASEHICDLKGSVLLMQAFIAATVQALPPQERARFESALTQQLEGQRTALLNALISEHTLAAFDRDAQQLTTRALGRPAPP